MNYKTEQVWFRNTNGPAVGGWAARGVYRAGGELLQGVSMFMGLAGDCATLRLGLGVGTSSAAQVRTLPVSLSLNTPAQQNRPQGQERASALAQRCV